jgi:hypothetical protein
MLTVLLSPATAVLGDDDGYYMVITYGAGSYEIGDNVDVVVHVFDKAAYTDTIDNVTLEVGSREMDLTMSGTGRWQGSFEILEEDVEEGYGTPFVGLIATGYEGETFVEMAFSTVMMASSTTESMNLKINSVIDPPSVYMESGETKTITWRIFYDDTLVEPTSFELSLDEDGSGSMVDPTRESTGVYSYEYTMPTGPRSSAVSLEFYANYETGSGDVDTRNQIDLFKNYLHVWAKKVAVSVTTASFDIYVSNMTGGPVEAAAINLDYSYYDDAFEYVQKTAMGTTDADGKASIDLPYNDLGDQEEEVMIEGKVTGQGFEQSLEFSLQVRIVDDSEPDEPDETGLDVIQQKEMFGFDKDVNLPSTAYFDGTAHSSGTIYWYAHTMNAVLNKGSTQSNVQGDLSIDFRTPNKGENDPDNLFTHYETPIDVEGTDVFYEDTEYGFISSITDPEFFPDNPWDALEIFRDPDVKVSHNKLEKSKDVPVTVEYSGANDDWRCLIILGNDPKPSDIALVPAWTYWTKSFTEGMYGDQGDLDGNKWQASVFVPDNLPNKDFFIAAYIVNQNELMASVFSMSLVNYMDWVKTNFVDDIEIGQSGSSGGEGDDSLMDTLMDTLILGIPLLYWIFIIIILAIVGVGIARISRRKGSTKAIAEPGLEPSDGPSFDQGYGAAAMPMPAASYDEMQAVPGQAEHGQPMAEPAYAPPPAAEPAYTPPSAAEQAYAPLAEPETTYAPPPAAEPAYAPPPAPEPEAPGVAGAAMAGYAVQQQAGAPPPQPAYQAPVAPPPEPAPVAQPPMAPPQAGIPQPPQPAYAPPPPAAAPEVPPPAPAPMAPPPAGVPPPAAVPPPVAAAPVAPPPAAAPAPAADPGATMTIRCQKCQTTLTIPRKRPIKVTCPNCGASGVMR